MINYIIVDDEPLAHSVIEKYCESLTHLNKVSNCYNAKEALDILYRDAVELIFLDINMPEISGYELIRGLKKPPKIIVTSAYQEYAIEGYELDVSDYLLKPFSLSRFMKAINKVSEELKPDSSNKVKSMSNLEEKGQVFFLKKKGEGGIYKVLEDEILYLEAKGNYCKVTCSNQEMMVPNTLSNLEEELSSDLFARIHRSFIVAINKIRAIEGNRVIINQFEIPVGKSYKHQLHSKLDIKKP